jgi:hypothetical protein
MRRATWLSDAVLSEMNAFSSILHLRQSDRNVTRLCDIPDPGQTGVLQLRLDDLQVSHLDTYIPVSHIAGLHHMMPAYLKW